MNCQFQQTGQCDILHCENPCGRSMELSSDYFLIFNNDLRLTDINSACIKTLKDHSVYKNKLLGKDIFFYIPELKEPMTYDRMINFSAPVEIFRCDEYLVKSPVNKDSIFVNLRIKRFETHTVLVGTDITNLVEIKEIYDNQEKKLNQLTEDYNNLKVTLDVLLNKINEKSEEVQKFYYLNMEEMVFPLLDLLKCSHLTERQLKTMNVLESNLKSIMKPICTWLETDNCNLTHREIQIAEFIRMGKTTKEISDILCLSCKTIDFHRSNIRKKLNIKNTSNNLRSSLLTK
ncbi:helix-turn-helix transcriptional regulator [Dehalobacter sp. DCM]|uniref:helix-turn-helix transcriptional regulator n=1 Tax=Dehalobacter sp. DCM TaxID=2907827 RepID=UPI0030816F9F|nr:helix-turn-helix transcriptional regulator [Dehalobacter sp. DCM]